MAPNKRKILEAARKHAQKGAKERALKEYDKLLKLDPRDAKLRLEIGDAYRRWGQVEEAIAAYQKVAEQYMGEGFDARAVAVFKQIHNLDPERWESYPPLAELYQRMGLTSEAIQALQSAADGHHRAGRKREALELLRKMVSLDPTNTASRVKVADLLRQEGMHVEAVAEYEAASEELGRQGEHEDLGRVLERILEVDENHLPALVQLAANLLQRGHPERAEPFAKRALEADGEEVAHYELLADVYRAQQRDEELAQTYRALADLHRRRGEDDRARDIIQRFVPMDGLSPGLAEDTDPASLSQPEPEMLREEVLDAELLDDELLGGELLAEPAPATPPSESVVEETFLELSEESPEPAATRQRDVSLEPPVEGDPDQLLAEASVYLRYGKRDQAIRNLQGILAADPDHRGALEKLGEAHADGGEPQAAVEAWLRAAERARADGDVERLGVVRDRIAALDPEAAASLGHGEPAAQGDVEELLEFSDEGLEQELPPRPEPELAFADDIDIDIDEADFADEAEDAADLSGEAPDATAEPSLEVDPDLSLREAEAAASLSLGASLSMSEQVNEDVEEAEFYRQQGLLDEAEAIYQRVLQVAPNHPVALVRMGEIAASRGEDPARSTGCPGPATDADPTQPPPSEPEERADEAVAAPPDGADLGEWTDDGLELDAEDPLGADALSDTGLEDESDGDDDTGLDLEPVSDAGVLGDTPVAEDAAAELSLAAEQEASPDSFDLAAELSDALDDEEGSSSTGSIGSVDERDVFSAVFGEFKKGVSETLGEGDYEARYDLGIAYREMGLLGDAKAEFQAALGCADRRTDALHMLALCSLDQGLADEAATRLEEALGEGVEAAQALALRFDLGRAFAERGDVEGARAAWEAVVAEDPGFRDAAERLAALEDEKPEAEAAAAGPEEGFESFQDLFEDEEESAPAQAEVTAPEHESFEDLMAEVEEEGGAEEPEAESPAVEPEAEPEAPAPEPAAAPDPEPAPRRRRKPKISFV